ncbi:hypothetical protein BT96DRAFT_982994 [Gymnopus androsaceus JB14]|uniref:Uncharacterized protein n=1 Tax=Gymnopus androsaceus JB14 TaxID=1447944 RepID=A0A6A4IN71_9AGAR|nr:hypothetical protein BT96DRAFT_982994 [Gymnopus androsaceus JB14]
MPVPTRTLCFRLGFLLRSGCFAWKAKTPIIAGSIVGGLMGLAWILGFAIYFRKRYKRKMRNQAIAAGKREAIKNKEEPQEKIVIPPDPALLMGYQPGERYVREKGEFEPPAVTTSPSGEPTHHPTNIQHHREVTYPSMTYISIFLQP